MTGEVAVPVGADGEGIAGDLVSTPSRLQAVAPPGGVLVGEGTRRAPERAVVYEAACNHALRGQAGLVWPWTAPRVGVASTGTPLAIAWIRD